MNPTIAGFQWFIANIMGITSAQLPTTAGVIAFAYNMAYNTVNPALACMPNANTSEPTMYATAVYNLAADLLINFAQDTPPSTYFKDLRASFGCNSFVGGVISSTGDEGTNQSMTVPEFANTLTISQLQNLKTPYGRIYLGIAQAYGPLWGLS